MTYPYEAALRAERTKNRAHDAVVAALEQAHRDHGLTHREIAERLSRSLALISRWLAGPANWTLETVSDLLDAASAEMKYSVMFDADRGADRAASQPAPAEGDGGQRA